MKARNKDLDIKLAFLFFLLSFFTINIKILIGVGVLLFLLVRNKFKIAKNFSLIILLVILFIGIFSGVANNYSNYNFIRDLSYYLGPIIFLIVGSQIYHKYNNNFSIIRTFILYTFFDSLKTFFSLVVPNEDSLYSSSFNQLRENTMGGEMIVPLTLIILIFQRYFTHKQLFSNKLNKVIVWTLLFRLGVSFSRAMLVLFFVYLVVFLFFKDNYKYKKKIIIYILLLPIVGIYLFSLVPEDILTNFLFKIQNTFTEISSNYNWSNYETIVNNWRGYESSISRQVFISGTPMDKIFGFGFGKLVPVMYSDLVGVPLSEGGITILHNGFYFNLIKTGIVGIALYVIYFLNIIFKNRKKLSSKTIIQPFAIAISLGFLVSTLVITGFFQRNFDAGFIMIFSMSLAQLRRSRRRDDYSYNSSLQ